MRFSPKHNTVTLSASVIWHGVLFGLAGRLRHPRAAVLGKDIWRSLNLYYHALGGDLASRLGGESVAPTQLSTHRGLDLQAWSEPGILHLPKSINRYSTSKLNQELYYWLTAYLAFDKDLPGTQNLAPGIRHLAQGVYISTTVLKEFPSLKFRYERLCEHELKQRRLAFPDSKSSMPARLLESAFRYALGSEQPPKSDYLIEVVENASCSEAISSSSDWNNKIIPFLPVPLWSYKGPESPGIRIPWIKRRVQPKDDGIQKQLKEPMFNPDIGIQPADGRSANDRFTYPEWDCFTNSYRPDWTRVTERSPKDSNEVKFDSSFEQLVARIGKRYALIHPETFWNRNLENGEELDIDAFVNIYSDSVGCGHNRSNYYREKVRRWRDLTVVVLLDASRSTDSLVGESRVIEVAKQSVAVLSQVLASTTDQFALYAFSSDSRIRVRCDRIKELDEPYDEVACKKLLAIQPANYTRMGAAIRHVGSKLFDSKSNKRLLLVLSDGRPHDPTDQYEGRYALEDTRKAIMEMRQRNVQCFGLTIDKLGHRYIRHLYGPGHYAVYSHLHSLPNALPHLYARLTDMPN